MRQKYRKYIVIKSKNVKKINLKYLKIYKINNI